MFEVGGRDARREDDCGVKMKYERAALAVHGKGRIAAKQGLACFCKSEQVFSW